MLKIDKYNIVRKKGIDRRIKLSKEDIEEIKILHAEGTSIHKLAKIFGVSRRLIQFKLYPERYESVRRRRKENGKDGRYYDKEYNTKAITEHREYKKNLLKTNKSNLILKEVK